MKPVVILDTNVLFGRRPLTGSGTALLLSLAKTDLIRLVVPDVVVHERSRQWAEGLDKSNTELKSALRGVNDALYETGVAGLTLEPLALTRSVFYEHALEVLGSKGVEVPPCPDVQVADLVQRELDVRRPFMRDGTGYRSTLTFRRLSSTQGRRP